MNPVSIWRPMVSWHLGWLLGNSSLCRGWLWESQPLRHPGGGPQDPHCDGEVCQSYRISKLCLKGAWKEKGPFESWTEMGHSCSSLSVQRWVISLSSCWTWMAHIAFSGHQVAWQYLHCWRYPRSLFPYDMDTYFSLLILSPCLPHSSSHLCMEPPRTPLPERQYLCATVSEFQRLGNLQRTNVRFLQFWRQGGMRPKRQCRASSGVMLPNPWVTEGGEAAGTSPSRWQGH